MPIVELAAFFTHDLENKQTNTMATTTDSTEPTQLQNYRPSMSTDTVHKLVRDLYGLHVLTCRELDSYDDRNFHVQVDGRREAVRNDHLPEVWPHGYVLKVLNSLDSKKPEVIEAKNIMTLAAADKGFPTPRPVPSVSGQLFVLHPLVSEQDDQADTQGVEERKRSEIFLIRLMEYLPGTILASVPLTSDLSFQIGQYAAQLDRVLKDVDDSQFPELLVNWNMQNVPSLRRLTCYIDDAKMVSVVTEVIDAFESRVLQSEDGRLQTGLIHSDFNDHNILVEPVEIDGDGDPTPSSSSVHRVCGILDFGDSTKTFMLVEIAVAMAYLILQCSPELDPDEMAGHALAGYLSELTLNPAELDLLPLTICARLSHTLTFGYHRRVLDPDNEYCLVHARKFGACGAFPDKMSSHHGASFSRHQSYNNRFRTSSSDGGDSHAAITTASTSNTHQLISAQEGEVDVFGHSTHFGKLSLQESKHEGMPDPGSPGTSQEQPRHSREVAMAFGANSSEAALGHPTNASNADAEGQVPVPMAPGKPRRLSRQTSAGAKRQNFAASRSISGGNNNSTSVDSTRDDVFVELDVEGAQNLHQQQPHALYDSSLFPSKKHSHQIPSTSSSTAAVLPNPYNRLNHRLHDAVWFCNCLYFVFFCCLPAIHYMEQSDVQFRLDNQKRASRLGRVSTVLFLVGALLALLFFCLVFFLVIYFTTK